MQSAVRPPYRWNREQIAYDRAYRQGLFLAPAWATGMMRKDWCSLLHAWMAGGVACAWASTLPLPPEPQSPLSFLACGARIASRAPQEAGDSIAAVMMGEVTPLESGSDTRRIGCLVLAATSRIDHMGPIVEPDRVRKCAGEALPGFSDLFTIPGARRLRRVPERSPHQLADELFAALGYRIDSLGCLHPTGMLTAMLFAKTRICRIHHEAGLMPPLRNGRGA